MSDLEHALQCADLAAREGAGDELVLAALLHDLGRLLAVADGRDPHREQPGDHHGQWGAAALGPFLPPRVTAAIEHHVAAKRYLCTVEPAYAAGLSPASIRSLVRQGGVLSDQERALIERDPWLADAVQVRRWDDRAKDSAAAPPRLSHYRELLERCLGPQSWEGL